MGRLGKTSFLVGALLVPSAKGFPAGGNKVLSPHISELSTASQEHIKHLPVKLPQHRFKTVSAGTEMLECGEGHKGLLTMSIDNSDPDATILVHAQLSKAEFTAFTGSAVEKQYKLKNVTVPLETVDDRCFLVRYKNDFGTIFCARNLHDRNQWMNYLHESILCEETGVKGRLPAQAGEELEKEEAVVQTMPVDESYGVNIHLSDSPLGKPQLLVNGVTVQEMEGIQRAQAVRDVFPSPPSPSIHEFPNPAASVKADDPDSLDAEGEKKTADAIAAMNEAEAEKWLINLKDPKVPENGYAKASMK